MIIINRFLLGLLAALFLTARVEAQTHVSSELRQILAVRDAAPREAVKIWPLKSRYPIWGVWMRDGETIRESLGSAMLWVDMKGNVSDPLSPADDLNNDGKIDRDDIAAGIQRINGDDGWIPGAAEYDTTHLVSAFNRYGQKVPGKTVAIPPRAKALMDRLEAQGLVEKAGAGWRAKKPAQLVFFGAEHDEGFLSHELNHALYFSESAFRDHVAKLWRGLPVPARDAIRGALAKNYALKDEDLLLTEFAAYGADGFQNSLIRSAGELSGILEEASRHLRDARDEFLPLRMLRKEKPKDGSRIWVLP